MFDFTKKKRRATIDHFSDRGLTIPNGATITVIDPDGEEKDFGAYCDELLEWIDEHRHDGED